MISSGTETSGASIDGSKIPLIIFYRYGILKRMKNLARNAFSSFCSIRWKFFKQQTPL